jgi:hypothetical protein
MKLHLVRLGGYQWQAAYRRDFVARHAWVDLGWWRLCLIWGSKL